MDAEWNQLESMAKEIKDTLTEYLLEYSWIVPLSMDEVFCSSPEGTRYYGDLTPDGVRMYRSLADRYAEFYSLLLSSLKDQPEEVLEKISKDKEIITRAIEHRLTICENTKQVLDVTLPALEDQMSILKDSRKQKS